MSTSILQRFQGSLVGGLVGDCIGGVFEGLWGSFIGFEKVLRFVEKLEKDNSKNGESGESHQNVSKKIKREYSYSDDTAMARSVVKSLIKHNGLNVLDLAQSFTNEYFKEPGRGYGGSIATVFKALQDTNCADVFAPANNQFDGQGSYGNGGAMRISPAGLFAFKKNLNFEAMTKMTEQITRITHSNIHAIHGAVLQCYATELSLSTDKLDVNTYLDELINKMTVIEEKAWQNRLDSEKETKETESELETIEDSSKRTGQPLQAGKIHQDNKWMIMNKDSFYCSMDNDNIKGPKLPYCHKLEKIREFVSREKLPETKEIQEELGVYIAALESVPAAIYCFLRATKEIEGLENRNPFERTLLYAISLGGDTDTVATMACSIAGAYYGLDLVPSCWYQCCEGVEDALKDAELLCNLT